MTDLATRSDNPVLLPVAPAAPLPLRRPRPARLRDGDVAAVLAATAFLTTATWARHGGVDQLLAGGNETWTSIARLSGLLASVAGLLGLVLVARARTLERRYGLDHLLVWHRYLGGTMAVALAVHVGAGFAAWLTPDQGVLSTVADLTGRVPYMAPATVGALLVAVVTVSSLRSIRRRLSYETWYFVHLTAYLGLALAFAHELYLGTDLRDDTVARALFVAAHVVVLGALVWGRWGRLVAAALHPLRVTDVTPLVPGTVSLTLGGPNLARIEADAGQFALLRPLRRRLWWQAHPYSLAAAPTSAGLRFTVKDRGDASGALTRLPVGTRVVVEGPYGTLTPEVFDEGRALLVAGGVGVAPVRALLEWLPTTARPVVLLRARSADELVHLEELRVLAAQRGGAVHALVGRTVSLGVDPFDPAVLRRAVPDLAGRTAVVYGPESLLHAAHRGLRDAGMPTEHIHCERPWW